ncbi:MAG: septum formation initiator family protein [Deltaproteobacteria bacterium]|nr:septum formation initiator family protein [Deltaproteobacteria bacterium]
MIDPASDGKSRLLNRVLLVALVTLVTTLAGVFLGGGSLRALADVKAELSRRKSANDLLASVNRDLREEVDALKDDPLVLEKAIRDELSLIDDREVFIVFDSPGQRPRVKTRPSISLQAAGSR